MAGIIDVRYNFKTKRWTAKPRFSYDSESYANGPASGDGIDPMGALYALANKLPLDLANKINTNVPRRIYRSPEYIWMNDKCLEIDGHCPGKEEWVRRRKNFLTEIRLGHVKL